MLAYFKRNAGRKIRLVSRWGNPIHSDDAVLGQATIEHDTASVHAMRDGKRYAIAYDIRAADFRETDGGFAIVNQVWAPEECPEETHIAGLFAALQAAFDLRTSPNFAGEKCYDPAKDTQETKAAIERAAQEVRPYQSPAPSKAYQEWDARHFAQRKRNEAPDKYDLGTKRYALVNGKLIRETWRKVDSLVYAYESPSAKQLEENARENPVTNGYQTVNA